MTALSKTYKIPDNNSVPASYLSDSFVFKDSSVNNMYDQSTLFKIKGEISTINRFEIQNLRSFKNLEENWDSYEAEKISELVINNAISIVEKIDKFDEDVYFSSPGPNGEIMIQLKNYQKEVEIIVYSDRQKYVTFYESNFEKQGDFNINILSEIVEWLNMHE